MNNFDNKVSKEHSMQFIYPDMVFRVHCGMPWGASISIGSPCRRDNTILVAFSDFRLIVFLSRLSKMLVNSVDLQLKGRVLITFFLGISASSSSDPCKIPSESPSLSSYELCSGDIASKTRAELILYFIAVVKIADFSVAIFR